MKYYKKTKLKRLSYTLVVGLIIIFSITAYTFKGQVYRSLVTINLGSLYVDYINSKSQFLNQVNQVDIPSVSVDLSNNNFVRIQKERSNMVNNYILTGSQWDGDNKYYKAKFTDRYTSSKSEIRLFGMNSDHFRNPRSHSFRIRFDGAKGIGKKTQNFLHPRSRDFITDPLLNIFYDKIYNGIRINYEPYIVYLNKTNYGIFYAEDFFDKYLIEGNKRRESVIFEVVNDSLEFNYLGEDNSLKSLGEELYLLYKYDYQKFLKKIDENKVKAVLKLCLLVNSGHPLSGINLHWYYNPVSDKIEPTIREAWIRKLSVDDIHNFPENLDLPIENQILFDIVQKINPNSIIAELKDELDEIENIIAFDIDYAELLKSMTGYSSFIKSRQRLLEENINLVRSIEIDSDLFPKEKQTIHRIANDTLIRGEFVVNENQTLLIDKDLTITLDGGYIKVLGAFKAKGSPNRKIHFKGVNNSGTLFFNTSKEVSIENVVFENLTNIQSKYNQPASITFYECDKVYINNSYFKSNLRGDDYINFFRTKNAIVQNSFFENVLNDAIDSDFSKLIVTDTNFINVGNDAIDGSGSDIEIYNSYFEFVMDKIISAGENSDIVAEDNEFRNSEIAIVSKDGSRLNSLNNKFINNNLDIASFIKKRFYDYPEIVIDTFSSNNYLIELGSKVIGIDSIQFISDVESKLYGNLYGRASE